MVSLTKPPRNSQVFIFLLYVVVALYLVASSRAGTAVADDVRPTASDRQTVAELLHQLRFALPRYPLEAIPATVEELRKIGRGATPQLIEGLRRATVHDYHVRGNCYWI